jgi:L-alanine-DL-glutamate epimerase-like enolase superfamily enzyme
MEPTHGDQAPDLLISGLRVRPVAVVPERPVQTAAGIMASTPLVLIDLQTREGVVGCSYVRCYTPLALAATARLLDDLGDIVVGARLDPDAVRAALQARFRLLGLQGLVTIAIAGVEMAAWDAKAKAHGVSLAKLLGGEPRPIPAYASLRTMSPGAAAEEAGRDRPPNRVDGRLQPEPVDGRGRPPGPGARRQGPRVASHTFPELSVQLLALTPTGHRLEYLDHAGAILTEPIRVAGGFAHPPDRPGSGLEWDEAAVARWAVS